MKNALLFLKLFGLRVWRVMLVGIPLFAVARGMLMFADWAVEENISPATIMMILVGIVVVCVMLVLTTEDFLHELSKRNASGVKK